jgi:hypothetical protein
MPLKPISLADAEPLAAVFPTYQGSWNSGVHSLRRNGWYCLMRGQGEPTPQKPTESQFTKNESAPRLRLES